MLLDDKQLFTDESFELIPAEGEIWPGSTLAVTVVFKPTEPKHYQQVRNVVIVSFVWRVGVVVRASDL